VGSLYLILALIFSLLIALLAVANTEPVTLNYIFGKTNLPLIILILGSAFAGALAIGLFSLFRGISNALAFRQARHEKEALQKKVKDLEEQKLFLEAELNKAVSVPEDSPETETAEEWEEPGESSNREDAEKTGGMIEESKPVEEGEEEDPHEPER